MKMPSVSFTYFLFGVLTGICGVFIAAAALSSNKVVVSQEVLIDHNLAHYDKYGKFVKDYTDTSRLP